jgi:hypothetical protein
MKCLVAVLVVFALPCMAQEKPTATAPAPAKAGFVGHKDCRVYFVTDSEFIHFLPDPPLATLARMTDAEKDQWRRNSVIHRKADDLTPDEEKWWAKNDYKKFPGLCYVPHSHQNDSQHAALNGPLFGIYFSQSSSSGVETQIASHTSSNNVPVEGQATVIDQNGNYAGTATVTGTVEVETTTRYPVDLTIYRDAAEASLWRLTDVGGSPGRVFTTYKSRRKGDLGLAGTIEAFRRDPRDNAFHECLKFLMLETGLKKK